MKMLAFLISSLLISGVANATEYLVLCEACSPFGPDSAAVHQAAVTGAQQNGAVVGDTIRVCRDFNPSASRDAFFGVNSVPVTSDSNLTLIDFSTEDTSCT